MFARRRFGNETALRFGAGDTEYFRATCSLSRKRLSGGDGRHRRSVGIRPSKEERMSDICRNCGCRESEARADARALGLQHELQRGIYTCCQIVAWADEQWLAWTEAAEQDGRPVDDVTKPLEGGEAEAVFVPVRRPDRHEPPFGNSRISGPSGGDRDA